MEQENRIVHGNCKLQNGAAGLGNIAYFAKKYVCTLVQHYCNADDY